VKYFLEQTKKFFGVRLSKPNVKILRPPSQVAIVMTTATSDKIEFALPDWAVYFRVSATNRIYCCIGTTIQSYVAMTGPTAKETDIDVSTWIASPAPILRVESARTLSLVPTANGAVWTTVEIWGEDDL